MVYILIPFRSDSIRRTEWVLNTTPTSCKIRLSKIPAFKSDKVYYSPHNYVTYICHICRGYY